MFSPWRTISKTHKAWENMRGYLLLLRWMEGKRWDRSVGSCQVCTYHPGCVELTIFILSLPLTTLSVRLHQVHFCVVRSVRCRCDPRCTKCRRVCLDSDYIPCCANQPIRSTKRNISTSSPCFHIFLSASGMMELNEAAAVVKLLEIQVYFSS